MKTNVGLISLLVFWLTSCRSPALFSDREVEQIIELARARVLEKMPDLDDKSKIIIRTSRPHLAYYKTAGTYSQYELSWLITSNREVVVSGQGDILQLEGARYTIHELDAKQQRYRNRYK